MQNCLHISIYIYATVYCQIAIHTHIYIEQQTTIHHISSCFVSLILPFFAHEIPAAFFRCGAAPQVRP